MEKLLTFSFDVFKAFTEPAGKVMFSSSREFSYLCKCAVSNYTAQVDTFLPWTFLSLAAMEF